MERGDHSFTILPNTAAVKLWVPNKHTSGVYFPSSWGLQQPPLVSLTKIAYLDEGLMFIHM